MAVNFYWIIQIEEIRGAGKLNCNPFSFCNLSLNGIPNMVMFRLKLFAAQSIMKTGLYKSLSASREKAIIPTERSQNHRLAH